MNNINHLQPLILFDGICNLCTGAVCFIIKRDKKNLFKFASLQSDLGQTLLKQFNLPVNNLNSIILITNGRVYTKSTAALKVAKELSGGWSLLYICIIIPAFIRDSVYRLIAKNRYKWFGKKESCWLPTPDLLAKFPQ